MLDLVMNNAIDAVIRRQQEETEERKKQYKRKEFEITTKYGARETRYSLGDIITITLTPVFMIVDGKLCMMPESGCILPLMWIRCKFWSRSFVFANNAIQLLILQISNATHVEP